VVVDPRGDFLAVVGTYRDVLLWDRASRRPAAEPAEAHGVVALVTSAEGSRLAGVTAEGMAWIWPWPWRRPPG
jgi:hypothetical protein